VKQRAAYAALCPLDALDSRLRGNDGLPRPRPQRKIDPASFVPALIPFFENQPLFISST